MGGRDDPLSHELVNLCDIISPNETEIKRLFESMNVPRFNSSNATSEIKDKSATSHD